MANSNTFLIATLIAFVAAPAFGSLMTFFGVSAPAPVAIGTGVGEPKAGSMGVYKRDFYMPEIQVGETKPRPSNFAYQVTDGPENPEPFDFPMGTQ